MKPLVRWTLGPTSDSGVDCLIRSIRLLAEYYANRLDYVVCYNGVSGEVLARLTNQVSLLDQEVFRYSLPVLPASTSWKFYPPRLRPGSHEIFLDNDVLIYGRSPTFDDFLTRDDACIVTSAYRRFYGSFDHAVSHSLKINSGMFGVPPGMDLGREIRRVLSLYPVDLTDHMDDEGMVAAIFANCNTLIIPMEEVRVCNPNVDFAPYAPGRCGTHFAGLNSGNDVFYRRFTATLPVV